MREQDQQTRVLYELCSMITHILGSPPLPVSCPSLLGPSAQQPLQISPAAFGSLFLGISFALMLLGSVIFLIGVLLMPLVITLALLFYFVGIICNLSEFGRAILWPGSHKVAQVWSYSSRGILGRERERRDRFDTSQCKKKYCNYLL